MMTCDVTLFGETRCAKTRFYMRALEERAVKYELAEVDSDPAAAKRLTELVGSPNKFPTFQIKKRKIRNPSLRQLDKELARAGFYDPGLYHDEKGQRIVRHMMPSDAFVSYAWRNNQMVLTHIEVDSTLRGVGIGTQIATEVFDYLETWPHQIRITCPFMWRVAATQPNWSDKFMHGENK